jgi:hypothetical protein
MVLVVTSGITGAQTPRRTTLPPDPMVGVCKLNLEKSRYATPPPKSMTVTIAPADRGYRFTIDSVAMDDQRQTWGFTSAFDGSESIVTRNPQIDAVVASSSGSGGVVSYKKAGTVITTTTSQPSEDGKTLVVTIKIPIGPGQEVTNLAVYERQ